MFHELTKDEVTQIVDLMLERLQRQLEGQGLGLELTDEAKDLLAEQGYDPTWGPAAASCDPAPHRGSLSEKILYKEFSAGEIIVVDVENWDGEGAGEDAKFTFRGEKKAISVPDALPVDLAKTSGDDGE